MIDKVEKTMTEAGVSSAQTIDSNGLGRIPYALHHHQHTLHNRGHQMAGHFQEADANAGGVL